jgi:hypothetical protein
VLQLNEAIAVVKAAGYRVSKAKAKAAAPKLNALGLPMSPNFDPNYRMKYRTPPLKRAQHVGTGVTPERWAEMCLLAQTAWNARAQKEAA